MDANADAGPFYYLNNTGHRWLIRGYKARLIVEKDNYDKLRVVKYFESFGNWAAFVFDYRGKTVRGLPDDTERDPEGYPIVTIREYPE